MTSLPKPITFNSPNLTEYHCPGYQEFRVQTETGPLYLEYLERTKSTIDRALHRHPKTFALRVDLRYPPDCDEFDSAVISRFFESLGAKLRADLIRKKKNKHGIPSEMNYVWAREFGEANSRPHYHLLILLNGDDYKSLGRWDAVSSSLFAKISQAWASALGGGVSRGHAGLVHIPENPFYKLDATNPTLHFDYSDLFYRASYLAKARTKYYGDNKRSFSAGRVTLV